MTWDTDKAYRGSMSEEFTRVPGSPGHINDHQILVETVNKLIENLNYAQNLIRSQEERILELETIIAGIY